MTLITYPESIDEFVKFEVVLLIVLLVSLDALAECPPHFFIFQNYFFQVVELDHYRVHLAHFAQFEKLDGRNSDTILRKCRKYYIE